MTNTTPLPTTRTYTERGTTIVSRTVMDTGTGVMFFEITVIRSHRQINPTYQGTVFLRDGQWVAETILPGRRGCQEIGEFAEFIDAENALVARRTGVISEQTWTGPRARQCEECDETYVGTSIFCPRPNCRICGHHLVNGTCRRPDLHWTPASIAAEEAARDERRRTRQTQPTH